MSEVQEYLISLNEEFVNDSKLANNNEDICGWNNTTITQISPKAKAHNYTEDSLPISQHRPRYNLTVKTNCALNSTETGARQRVDLTPKIIRGNNWIGVKTSSRQRNEPNAHKRFFPGIRKSLFDHAIHHIYKATYPEVFEYRQKFRHINESPPKLHNPEKAFRVTSASPVVMIRRKNYYG
ncbi:hypothetical protein SteCoe_14787 [Stentor coeruleus]|uniref:Uncharacterized protein n=1 Tax=Stentor coeruleus TaxID=5963 RepID=A0A1R2C5A4_9CILI|nr:hypothetical protein SteCoe_14787 [Stentor coeruleus]